MNIVTIIRLLHIKYSQFYKYLCYGSCLLFAQSYTTYAKVVVIQGAMDIELSYLKQQLQPIMQQQIGSWQFWTGHLGAHQIILSQTEIGLVNAAAATILAIEHYKPDLIINQGTAGGHDPKLYTGDIVVATRYYPLANLPFSRLIFWESNLAQLQDILNIMRPLVPQQLHLGIITSGDQWNREIDRINTIHQFSHSAIEEMESVAVAAVAERYAIPLLTLRILSNSELHQQNFDPTTATVIQHLIMRLLQQLPN